MAYVVPNFRINLGDQDVLLFAKIFLLQHPFLPLICHLGSLNMGCHGSLVGQRGPFLGPLVLHYHEIDLIFITNIYSSQRTNIKPIILLFVLRGNVDVAIFFFCCHRLLYICGYFSYVYTLPFLTSSPMFFVLEILPTRLRCH